MGRTQRFALVAALAGALLLAGCAPSDAVKGPATGTPTVYEFSTDS